MSKQIDLFADSHHKQPSHLEAHRPEKLNLSNVQQPPNPKWAECKVLGKNIMIRSYSAACAHGNELYVYGGLQILNGILSDFHSITLEDKVAKFQWVDVPVKGQVQPGPRAKHSLTCVGDKIYLIGGIINASDSSNDIYCYDIGQKNWKLVKTSGIQLPPIDSFGSVLIEHKIIIACGYNSKIGHFLNRVYQFNADNHEVTLLFDPKSNQDPRPLPRANCSGATNGTDTLYIFGGNESDHRFNDLWLFDINTKKYARVNDKEQLRPVVRSGHTLTYYDERLYIFGGIHQVTWELDDLHIYDLKTHEWTALEIDSARRKDPTMAQSKLIEVKKQVASPTKKKEEKYWTDTVTSNISGSKNQSHKHNPSMHHEESPEHNNSMSPGKMIDEQRKKEFLHKKAEMLKEFQVPQKQKHRYISVEPTTQAMRNSLDIIGNPNPRSKHPGKLTQFGKETCSKFLQPLTNNINLVIGKKPCARDGHNTIVMGDSFLIFGGDRHQMSFNDLYRLNMKLVVKQFPH